MPPIRRLWDSNLIIGYLGGQVDLKTDCDLIIEQAKHGELEIVVSTLAHAEVAFLKGISAEESEQLIREFFGRDYVIPAAYDIPVARIARGLIRRYREPPIKPPDAIHLATALLWHIPIIETTDPDLIRLDRREGNPPIIIRRPVYEGSRPLPGFSST